MIRSTIELSTNVVAMVGGGTNPMRGEIQFAHNGVLFSMNFLNLQGKYLEELRALDNYFSIECKEKHFTGTFPESRFNSIKANM